MSTAPRSYLLENLYAVALGISLIYAVLLLARPWVMAQYGFHLSWWLPDSTDLLLLAAISGLGLLFSLIPGAIAYRRSLQDGLTVRV